MIPRNSAARSGTTPRPTHGRQWSPWRHAGVGYVFIVLAVGFWPQAHKFIVLVPNSGVHGFGIGHEHVNVELISESFWSTYSDHAFFLGWSCGSEWTTNGHRRFWWDHILKDNWSVRLRVQLLEVVWGNELQTPGRWGGRGPHAPTWISSVVICGQTKPEKWLYFNRSSHLCSWTPCVEACDGGWEWFPWGEEDIPVHMDSIYHPCQLNSSAFPSLLQCIHKNQWFSLPTFEKFSSSKEIKLQVPQSLHTIVSHVTMKGA